MNFSFDKILDFLYDNYIVLLLMIIFLFQLVLIFKIDNISTNLKNTENKISNIQSILWITVSDEVNSQVVINKWILSPIEDRKAILPVKPDTLVWIAYIENWYSEMDSHYPIWKEIIYASSLKISEIWEKYKNQLVNTWWQVININLTDKSENYINYIKATNWQNSILVEFLEKFDTYKNKAWSFVKIVIEN